MWNTSHSGGTPNPVTTQPERPQKKYKQKKKNNTMIEDDCDISDVTTASLIN